MQLIEKPCVRPGTCRGRGCLDCMAQHFFDIEINAELVVDDEGIDLEDHAAARCSALSSLGDIIAEHIQASDNLGVDIRIRYADGTPIFAGERGRRLTGGAGLWRDIRRSAQKGRVAHRAPQPKHRGPGANPGTASAAIV